jgi:hypothetical protein
MGQFDPSNGWQGAMEYWHHAVTVGSEGTRFLNGYLVRGHRLAKLLNRHDLSKGTSSVWIPAGMPMEQALEFDVGGKFQSDSNRRVPGIGEIVERTPNCDDQLASLITQFLAETEGGVCVLENMMAEPSYPYVKEFESMICSFGDEVYHVVSSPRSGELEQARIAIAEAKSIPVFVAALTTYGTDCGPNLISGGEISEPCLSGLAARTMVIVAGIYDGESYLIWRRNVQNK